MALKGSGARVFAVMSGQFIRPRKLPTAAFPRTLVGLLARVSSFMSLQMRTFRVDLVALRKVTFMDFAPFQALSVLARDGGRGRLLQRLLGLHGRRRGRADGHGGRHGHRRMLSTCIAEETHQLFQMRIAARPR